MKIIMMEDEHMLAGLMKKKLVKNGYDVKIYNSSQEFLDNPDYNTDLYTIDISLGDGNGFNIIKHIRKEKGYKTPIMVISGFSHNDLIKKAREAGANYYLTKPFAPQELINRIERILHNKK